MTPRKSKKFGAVWCDDCNYKGCSYGDNISLSQLHYETPCRYGNTESSKRCEACLALLAMETEIRQMIANLRDLLDKHQNMKTEMNHRHSSFMQKLPFETISTIFLHCMPENLGDQLRQAKRQDVFVPLNLGAVSRTWRQIAWSTPQLWTHLAISHLGLKSSESISMERPLVEQWITRSKVLPLTISLRVKDLGNGHAGDGRPPRRYRPLLNTVTQSHKRWQDIYLDVPAMFLNYLLEQTRDLCNIRVLDLRSSKLYYHSSKSEMFKRGIPAPQRVLLRNLILRQVNINWGGVRHIDADQLGVNECLEIIRQAPLLDSCNSSNMSCSYYSQARAKPFITSRNLTHLDIGALSFQEHAVYLSAITLPNLAQLTFYAYYKAAQDPDIPIVRFLERSAGNLKKLHLKISTLPFTSDLQQLLGAVPFVTHLNISEHKVTHGSREVLSDVAQDIMLDPLLKHLAETTSHYLSDTVASTPGPTSTLTSAPFLPNLESLELSLFYAFKWSAFTLEIFDTSTNSASKPIHPRRPLRSLRITDANYPKAVGLLNKEYYVPQSVLPRVLDLQALGVEITLNYDGESDVISVSKSVYGI